MIFKPKQRAWVEAASAAGFPAGAVVGYPEIDAVCAAMGGVTRPWWLINDAAFRADRGKFMIPVEGAPAAPVAPGVAHVAPVVAAPAMAATVTPITAAAVPAAPVTLAKASSMTSTAIPDKFANYVPFGHFKDVQTVVASRMFYPGLITGLSGNGKTLMVEQVCAKAKRELFRVNITKMTDEDDLLGGFRMVDGDTVWLDGPVIEAMRRGAVLLLDEIDLGDEKLMCLQPVLEGKPILLKKIMEIVAPAPGFTILATANTKGKGSDDGRFIGTNVMNEAMLDRIAWTVEQEYPSVAVEKKIITKELASAGRPDTDFAEKLVNWADIIRKTFYEGGVDEIIATRRLVHIAKAYGIFADRMKAVTFCLARFDDETKESFMDLYTKVDEQVIAVEENEDTARAEIIVDADDDDAADLDIFDSEKLNKIADAAAAPKVPTLSMPYDPARTAEQIDADVTDAEIADAADAMSDAASDYTPF
jgi:MoxR-like ATPase